jgi:hypothetical protein
MPETAVTKDQAADALRQLVAGRDPNAPAPVEAAAAPEEPAQPLEAEPPAEPAEPAAEAAPADEPVEEAVAPATDDVASLKTRLTEREKQATEAEQRYQARLQALQNRSQESERILRERYLRKSTAADRALKILKATRTEAGVPETEVDRAIQEVEGTMNPASVSYAPPSNQTEANEDQAIALNSFLNEKQMDTKESDDFGRWIKTEGATALHPSEQALAYRDLDGFLRIAHVRYQESARAKETQRASAVEAVKTVQRAQKQVARAATAAPAAPRRTTVTSTPTGTIDYEKVTQDDVAKWIKQSVEQYK